MSTSPSPLTRPTPGVETAARLLADLRAEIARADSKAAVVVAALGMSGGVISGVLVGRDWTPNDLSRVGACLWWTGTAVLTAALLCLLMAVLPRYRVSDWTPGSPLTYFGDIQRAVRQNQLPEALATTERLPMTSLLAALTETSRIAARKHQWIRAGLVAFCLAALLLPTAVAIG
ncbi:Pycsar system effector family protein [Streptomyces sp. NPDC059346]|uniref:Pycsar system effector family protein n=1 Tax=Streptomyces sp. NPDC059346 TaxID=3346807 RepID=UPI0036C5F4CA